MEGRRDGGTERRRVDAELKVSRASTDGRTTAALTKHRSCGFVLTRPLPTGKVAEMKPGRQTGPRTLVPSKNKKQNFTAI